MYYISLYNTGMKLFFIASTAFIIYLMRYKKPFCTVSYLGLSFFAQLRFKQLFLHFVPTPHFVGYSVVSSSDEFFGGNLIALFIDLRCPGWWLPPLHGLTAGCLRANSDHQQRLDLLGVHVELQLVAWGGGLHPSNRDAQQDSTHRKYHLSLCRDTWSLQVLLHPQLGVQILRGWLLLLDSNSIRHTADWLIRRFPVLLLSEHTRRQTSHWTTHVKNEH